MIDLLNKIHADQAKLMWSAQNITSSINQAAFEREGDDTKSNSGIPFNVMDILWTLSSGIQQKWTRLNTFVNHNVKQLSAGFSRNYRIKCGPFREQVWRRSSRLQDRCQSSVRLRRGRPAAWLDTARKQTLSCNNKDIFSNRDNY